MDANRCMLGQTSGQIPGCSFPNILTFSMFGGNGLHHYPIKNPDTISDWHKDTRIGFCRDLIRNRISEILNLETNHVRGQHKSDTATTLENELFKEAASKEEYMNQETLKYRLRPLILRKIVDTSSCQQVGNHSTSPSLSRCIIMPGLTQDCNTDTPDPPFNQFTSTKYNPLIANNINQFDFPKGLPCAYEFEVANMFTASDEKNISSCLGMRQVFSEVVLSPEQTSTISTRSNGEGFCDVGAFDYQQVFPLGDLRHSSEASLSAPFQWQHLDYGNNQNILSMMFQSRLGEKQEFSDSNLQIRQGVLQILPEVSNTFMDFSKPSSNFENPLQSQSDMLESQQRDQWPHQPYPQLDTPSEVEAQCHFTEQNESRSTIVARPQLLSEESHVNSSILLPSPTEHTILRDYIKYKRSAEPIGDCQVSYLNHLHSTICDVYMCNCEHFRSVLSHFDDCHCTDCNLCGPVQHQCIYEKRHQKSIIAKRGLQNDFSNKSSIGLSSGCSEEMLHPSKRLKMESYFRPFSSESEISYVVAPLKPGDPEGLQSLQQWPESPVSINSEVMQVNMNLLRYPIKDSTGIRKTVDNAADNFPRSNAEKVPSSSEEPVVSHKPEDMDLKSVGQIPGNVTVYPNGIEFNTVPVLAEKLAAGFEEEEQGGTKVDLAKPEINEFSAQESNCGVERKSEKPEIRGVSLIDFFTEEQIKEHISSLRRWISQSLPKEKKGNERMYAVSENSCQLCAADKLSLAPAPIYCSSCGARVKRSVIYYSTPEENGMHHCFCTLCYKESRGGTIKVCGVAISKVKLHKKKNNEETEESWVQCDKCEGWQHQICALFNDKRDMEGKAEYICPKCCLKGIQSEEFMPSTSGAVLGAKDLPSTMLSKYIEQRLFRRLQQERKERANATGKSIDEVPGPEDLVVRVVLSVDQHLSVKKQFLDFFHGNYPAEFPYRSKVILLFQKIEGVDVCLFVMYAQEFGSECGHPNQRCVYISYLDSVKHFRPERETAAGEALRTFVYHEILIGYLEYCKKQGFATCYLWACPPLKGEDYILYCHPEIQKTPKSDKLRQWYQSLLRKAAKEKVVVNFTNLYDHFFIPTGQCNSKITAARLPYFDGDYWSGAAEDIIKNIKRESGEDSQRKVKKLMTKRTLKAMGHTNPSGGATKDILLMQKLGQTILPVKEDFIVVHLQFVCTHCHEVILSGWRWFCGQCKNFQLCERCHDAEKNVNGDDTHTLSCKEKHLLSKVMVDDVPSDTKDNDVILDNNLFENRHTFLRFCQQNHYQFDTLRRAKHSSMMILHHLRNPTVPTSGISYTAGAICSICHRDIMMDMYSLSEIFPKFDVCVACCQTKGASFHVHGLTQHSSTVNHVTKCKEAQPKLFLELLGILQHAARCHATKSDACSYPNCFQIKKLFIHVTKCTIRAAGGCQPCMKAWFTLRLHSKNCKEPNCPIPRCRDLKKHAEAMSKQSESQAAVAELVK